MGARLIYPYTIIPGDARSGREKKIAASKQPQRPGFHSRRRTLSLMSIRNHAIILDTPHLWSYTGAAVHI
jgi:hypothetical protein